MIIRHPNTLFGSIYCSVEIHVIHCFQTTFLVTSESIYLSIVYIYVTKCLDYSTGSLKLQSFGKAVGRLPVGLWKSYPELAIRNRLNYVQKILPTKKSKIFYAGPKVTKVTNSDFSDFSDYLVPT